MTGSRVRMTDEELTESWAAQRLLELQRGHWTPDQLERQLAGEHLVPITREATLRALARYRGEPRAPQAPAAAEPVAVPVAPLSPAPAPVVPAETVESETARRLASLRSGEDTVARLEWRMDIMTPTRLEATHRAIAIFLAEQAAPAPPVEVPAPAVFATAPAPEVTELGEYTLGL